MTARMGAGDTAVNLAAAGLVLNAWILTGDPRYRDWIAQYAGAWRERAAANHGIIPDNAGPDGVTGSLLDGRWYGGGYRWAWPPRRGSGRPPPPIPAPAGAAPPRGARGP